MYRSVQEGQRLIRINEGIKDILQGEDTVKLIKSFHLRRYGHVERMKTQRIPKQIASASME